MNSSNLIITTSINESVKVKKDCLLALPKPINMAAKMIVATLKNNKKILICGNGGSAADSQHLATELVSRFKLERPALPVMALTTNTSILTAISNDYSFDSVFSRQVEAYGKNGDVLIAISTSGNATNVINAIQAGKRLKMKTIGFTGKTGGKMRNLCDILINVPSDNTPRIQEAHITIGHIICEIVEKILFGKK